MRPDRQEASDRIAARFAAMNEPAQGGRVVALIAVLSITAVIGLATAWAITEWWTALNAAQIDAGRL